MGRALQMKFLYLLTLLWVPLTLTAREAVTIRVNAAEQEGAFKPIWSYFGYDEPNFTYMKNGKKLLSELSALSAAPVYIRTHNLLTSGDGVPALKWGSTNAYTEDASGRPVYNWMILDRIFDAYMQAKMKPLVEIGFMPEALSIHPQPYQHDWPHGPLSTGWAYPPKDYNKWAELIYHWVRHAIDRYGKAEVQSWLWEAWNEPNIGYWRGAPDEYFILYDYSVDAVKRALPEARVGGPDSTGPADPRAAEFLRRFLEHCARGVNYTTGRKGAPPDFIAFHPKGSPKLVEGHVRMGIAQHLQHISQGFEIVASYPEFRNLPIILGESDPEGCAACPARLYPQNAYRNGPLYPCYTAAVLEKVLDLAARHHVDIQGVVTWAFEFEGQPYFEGFRTLATNGIDKPVLNVFRMFGLMSGARLSVTSTQAAPLDSVLQTGVQGQPDINAMATRLDRKLSVMLWNYHDDDVPAPDATIELFIDGLPDSTTQVLVHHYRVDQRFSNAYTAWKAMGSTQNPTADQYARLEALGQLQPVTSPQSLRVERGRLRVSLSLPRHGTSLLQLTW